MEYTLIKVPSLTQKTKTEVGTTADIMVVINGEYYRTKSSTFLINIINDLTTGGTADALSAEQGKTLLALIDWQNYAEGFTFDYTANWTLTPSGTDVDVVIPTCDILAPNSSTPVERTGTSGTISENGGLVLALSMGVYSYVFVDDLTNPLYVDGVENKWVIVKNVGGNLYSRNVSLMRFLQTPITTYLGLTDSPSTRSGLANYQVTVNSGETADEYTEQELAGTGVTYGHVNDQAQTIAGAKTWVNGQLFGTVGTSSEQVYLGYDVVGSETGLSDAANDHLIAAKYGGDYLYGDDSGGKTKGIAINKTTGNVELLATPTADATGLNSLVRNSSGGISINNPAYVALTAGAAVAYNLNTGLNKTLSVAVDSTITFTNMASKVGRIASIRLNVTVISDIILAGSGVTFAGSGTLTNLPIGTYDLELKIISATIIDYKINYDIPTSTDLIKISQTGITSDTTLSTQLLAGQSILRIVAVGKNANTISGFGLQFGSPTFAALFTPADIVGAKEVSYALTATFYSMSTAIDIQVYASAWNSGEVDVYIVAVDMD